MPSELGFLLETFRYLHFFVSEKLQRGDASSVQLNLGVAGVPRCLRLGGSDRSDVRNHAVFPEVKDGGITWKGCLWC
ncbi:hypothetical protein UB31_12245 [Bradyrhizobium sp. LTSP849]|nr:hypothetical protein UB31_12245 [Bradyrhizobium sp. LTSP849]